MSLVRDHFNAEAARYDSWKQRNWYYYAAIKRLYEERIPKDASVLEIGCGTGDILAHIAPRRGVGIDISSAMIALAKEKHPEYTWYACTISELPAHIQETFDSIFLSDVIEHLEDVDGTLRDLRRFCSPSTRLIINMANPLWEPVLLLLEKLHKKMPEGPHKRISVRTLTKLAEKNGFQLRARGFTLLFPKYVPFFSRGIRLLEKIPGVRRLCLIYVLEYS